MEFTDESSRHPCFYRSHHLEHHERSCVGVRNLGVRLRAACPAPTHSRAPARNQKIRAAQQRGYSNGSARRVDLVRGNYRGCTSG